MKKSTIGRLSGALVILAGVGLPGPQLHAAPVKPPNYTPVPLVVTVEAEDSSGRPCRICVENPQLGSYANGIDGVTANFDSWGNLIINFNATRSTVVRKLRFSYEDPLDPGNAFRPPAALNSYLSTQAKSGGISQPYQGMAVGAVQCTQANFTFTDDNPSKTMYRTHFHRPLAAEDGSDTSYLVVTRVSMTTWEVEPKYDPSCNPANETVARLFSNATKGSSLVTSLGAYFMPFKMTLTKQ